MMFLDRGRGKTWSFIKYSDKKGKGDKMEGGGHKVGRGSKGSRSMVIEEWGMRELCEE